MCFRSANEGRNGNEESFALRRGGCHDDDEEQSSSSSVRVVEQGRKWYSSGCAREKRPRSFEESDLRRRRREYSSDFEEEEEKRTEEATKEDREKEEEKEDFNAAPASTTTTTTTATFLGPKPPPRRFQSAFDIARKALRREEHFLSATTTTQTTSTDATLVVDAHAFGGKAFRGSWAGTSGRFAFCDGSKIVERAVVPVEDVCGLEGEEDGLDEEEAKRAMMTFQARAIKNGLKCFEAFSEKEADPRCRLNVPAEDVKEFCRVHCEALANALMLLNNSGDGSNSNSNADDEYGCKTRRRQRIASKTKRAIELWDLLELLYKKDELGAQRGSAADTFRRKQSLSKWLKRSLKRAEMEKALEMDAQPMDFDDDDDDTTTTTTKKRRTTIQSLWHCRVTISF